MNEILAHPALPWVLLAVLAVLALLWWRAAARSQALAAQLQASAEALRQGGERLSRTESDLAREGQLRLSAEGQLAEVTRLREAEALRAGRAEVQGEGLAARLDEVSGERDGLTDALHAARNEAARLERELAETRLDARKDREAAAREVETLKQLRQEMSDQFRLMSSETLRVQGEGMEKRQGEQLAALLTPFRDQVQRFQSELQARNEKTDEERVKLREQIAYLHQRSEDISREAVALTRALKGDTRKQGAWGEMILARILEDSGLQQGIHYDLQTSRTDEEGRRWRPDCIVRMPQERVLVIDSKVSLIAYEQAVNAEDEASRTEALARHIASLRAHIRALAGKGYQTLEAGTVDYVLMFIPVEGAFSDAMRADPELAREAMEARIGLATPTTLMLTLRTVDHIWTVERRESNAVEIANRAGQLYDKVAGFVTSMEDVGRALARATTAHDSAMDRLSRGRGNVIRQVEMLRELGARAQKRIDLDHDGEERAALPPDGQADAAE